MKSIERRLNPRQQRTITMLNHHPEGVLSYDLRTKTGVMNISDVVCQLRAKGFEITCQLENHTDQDGQIIQIGRYFLQS